MHEEIMNELASARELNLTALFRADSPWRKIISAEDEQEAAEAARDLVMARSAGEDSKWAYLRIRDEMRQILRSAERLQRARRKAERALRERGETRDDWVPIYHERMWDRPRITALIRARRGLRLWARSRAANGTSGAAA